jgi:hypothetical protein
MKRKTLTRAPVPSRSVRIRRRDNRGANVGAITPERETPPVSGSIPLRQKLPFHHFSRSGLSRQLRSQVYIGSVGAENFPYFVAHPAKNSENLSVTSRSFSRIVKAPVVPFHRPGNIGHAC